MGKFGSALSSKLATEITNFILGKGKYHRQKGSKGNLLEEDRPASASSGDNRLAVNLHRQLGDKYLQVNDNNFEAEVLKSDLPVLVDFYAEWCGPCKIMGPIIDEIAEELKGKLKIVKINVDDAQNLATQFHIMSIPTLIVFKGGDAVDIMVGTMPKVQLLNRISDKWLGKIENSSTSKIAQVDNSNEEKRTA